MEAELVDDRRVLFCPRTHFDAVPDREGPVGGIGMGQIGKLVGRLLVESGSAGAQITPRRCGSGIVVASAA